MANVQKIDEQVRARAEAVLRDSGCAGEALPPRTRELIQKLMVHQLELELKNQQLRDAQRELETSRARYRELYEHAPMACVSIGADGEIVEANKTAGMLLGARPSSLVGVALAELLAPECAAAFEHHCREVLASDTRCSCTVDLLLPGGERREVRLESMRAGESRTLFRAALVDLTEIHRLQRELQHAHRLEAMGVLASGIAHDFNNLLMAMIGCADMALAAVADGSDARTALEELKRTAMRGRGAVSELLTFARPSERRSDAIDLHAEIRARQVVLNRLTGADVQIDVQLRALDPFIRLDPGQLDQILLNLAINARHAMPDGGVLRIVTRTLEPQELESDVRAALGPSPCVLLEVSDSGAGMDEAVRARAFEPFFTTKPAGKGTGLGLSMVYGTVKRGGGYCELHSRIGEGTAIRMYFPVVGGTGDRHRSGAHRIPTAHDGPTVLVVEDDRLVRLAIRHYLEQRRYRVIESGDGQQALARLRAGLRVELLLSDVVLPGLKGPEIVAAARALQPQLRVLLVSAHAPELLRERGWLQPGVPILRKPFTCEELHQAVAEALGSTLAAAC